MSLVLGKIHYWLFNKIKWFEGLEENILEWSEDKKEFPLEQWKDEIYSKYGMPTEDKPLEEMINTSNIHGWLQDKIFRAEGRQSAWVTRILNKNPEYINDLISIFEKQGTKLGSEYAEKAVVVHPVEIYNMLNDYILEGMPCDRVNETLENNEDMFSWRTTKCLHATHWEEEGGDVNNFYKLREAWVKSFVKALNSSFRYYVTVENATRLHEIKR
ncbi:hypothetical protein GCM10008905_22630 [Clostridium malenominatum]|uniref:Uncharacterized protein n=1 Tax=Clostridium malenominatum TaxID=1539 RepID=A0ABN1J2A6_9CLOT